jgi:HSP20 family protein
MYLRPYRYRSPWREMERLRRDMNRLVSGISDQDAVATPGYPSINVWTSEDGAVVTAELPGVEASDIDISVVGDTLTLSGSRGSDELDEGGTYHRRERRHGRFTRAVKIPFPAEPDGVAAVFEKGVLTISLPRLEADKPRRITVRSA